MQFRSMAEINRMKSRVNAMLPLVAWALSFGSGVMTSLFTLMLLRDDIPTWLGYASLAAGAAANVLVVYGMIVWYVSREKLRSAANE